MGAATERKPEQNTRLRNKTNDQRDSFEQMLFDTDEYEDAFFQAIDRIVTLSHFTYILLRNEYKHASSKLSIVYNGLCDVCHQPIGNKSLLQSRWNLSPDEKLIFFAGRLDEVKGLSFLIHAFRKVLKIIPGCRLLIAGSGNYDIYMKEVRDMCTKITFTGLLEKTKLYELYSIADIGVMPSFHEQCSYVAIEMMMHGLPIIASTSTGLKEMIEDGVNGLHIPVTEYQERVEIDTSLLAEKILYLLQNPDKAKRLGENARKRYENVYSSEVMKKNMLQLYQSLIR